MKKIFFILFIFINICKSFGQVTVIPKTESDKPKIEEKEAEKVIEKTPEIIVETPVENPKDSITKTPIYSGKMKITATILNRNGDFIYIKMGKNRTKKIKINEAGFFSDTLSINNGFYQFYDGVNYADIYVKDGYDMIINADGQNFTKSIAFSGDGAAENNFMATSRILETTMDFKTLMNMKYGEFKAELDKRKSLATKRLQAANFENGFNIVQEQKTDSFIKDLENFYKKEHEVEKEIKITNVEYKYPDYDGKMTSTKEFSGSYVFLQVWSMNSGASEAEAPYLREIIRKYSPQGFSFVNICIDLENGSEVEKWKKYIDEHGLTGTQLLADAGWKSKIIADFGITTLPRYILLDPSGKLMQPNAPRPSSPNLRAGFEQLLNGGYDEDGK